MATETKFQKVKPDFKAGDLIMFYNPSDVSIIMVGVIHEVIDTPVSGEEKDKIQNDLYFEKPCCGIPYHVREGNKISYKVNDSDINIPQTSIIEDGFNFINDIINKIKKDSKYSSGPLSDDFLEDIYKNNLDFQV